MVGAGQEAKLPYYHCHHHDKEFVHTIDICNLPLPSSAGHGSGLLLKAFPYKSIHEFGRRRIFDPQSNNTDRVASSSLGTMAPAVDKSGYKRIGMQLRDP